MGRRNASVEATIRELDLEVTYEGRGYTTDFMLYRTPFGRTAVVGYLMQDDQCSSPLDGEGMGKIITKREERSFLNHVGCDEDSDPILDEQCALLARLRGEELDGFECDTNAVHGMWMGAFKRGRVGTPFAQPLHSMYRGGFDVCDVDGLLGGRCDAVWIPDKELEDHLKTISEECRQDEAKRIFENILEEYNKWAEGDCWGWVTDVFHRDSDGRYRRDDKKCESCWGFIGQEYALEQLNEEMVYMKKALKIKGIHGRSV